MWFVYTTLRLRFGLLTEALIVLTTVGASFRRGPACEKARDFPGLLHLSRQRGTTT